MLDHFRTVRRLRRHFLTDMAGAGLLLTPMAARASSPTKASSLNLRTVTPGFLTVAMTGEMPMAAVENGKLIGVDGEMVALIASKLGLKIKPEIMDFGSMVEAVRSGRADVVVGDIAWSPLRAMALALTDAIYFASAGIVVKKGRVPPDTVITVSDLSGHDFGTLVGGATVPELKKIPGITTLKLYDTSQAVLMDVVQGRLYYASIDSLVADYQISRHADWDIEQLKIKPDPAYPVLTGSWQAVIGVSPDNPTLFDAINQGVAWLWRSGETAKILPRYGLLRKSYLTPPAVDERIGVDRNQAGLPIGIYGHKPVDFSSVYAA